MILSTQKIQEELKEQLRNDALKLHRENKLGKLYSIIIGNIPEQESYVRIKKRVGAEVGIEVEKVTLTSKTNTEELLKKINDLYRNQNAKGIIIQQPMPNHISLDNVYENIPIQIEIEGHKKGSKFVFPLVQACMIGLHEAMQIELKQKSNSPRLPYVAGEKLVSWLNSKNIVIAGNGITTGSQIAKHFKKLGISFLQTNSKTDIPDELYAEADIIITGVGKKILGPKNIKKGAILLNFGLRSVDTFDKEIMHKRLRGDYDEDEIKDIASIYTSTPGGLGPIDVLCLLGNHLEACRNTQNAKL